MDAVDLVILALRLGFVVLLYLFLVLVLRRATQGLSDTATAPVRSRATLHLVVLEPGASALTAGEVLAIQDGATLGRGELADVVLTDTAVSAEHARLERHGRRWAVRDLGSTNGTRVNDGVVRERTAQLSEGDVLTLGTVRLQVVPR